MNRSLPVLVRHAVVGILLVTLALPLHGTATVDAEGPAALPWVVHPRGDVPMSPQTLAADDVTFTLVDVRSDFATEEYKQDEAFSTRNANDVENQTTDWSRALGHQIVFTVEVEGDGSELSCDDRFVAHAYIETTGGRLNGWTNGAFKTDAPGGVADVCTEGLPGVRVFDLAFDLDGAPPTVTGAAYPVLGPGSYSANLVLYHSVTPTPSDPSGEGPLAGHHVVPFHIAAPDLRLDEPLMRFPERSLRLFTDVGAAPSAPHQFLMPDRPLGPDGSTNLTISFTGAAVGARFERIDHYATRTGVGLETPTDPPNVPEVPVDPANEQVQGGDDRATVTVERLVPSISNDTVPESRAVLMQLRGSDFPSIEFLSGGVNAARYVPLQVLSIHLPASRDDPTTGVGSFVLPVSERDYPVRALDVDPGVGGVLGTTSVTFQDRTELSGGPSGVNAGDLFALRSVGTSFDVVTRERLSREAGASWVQGTVSHINFDQVSQYLMLGMFYGGSDEFLGMARAQRGIDLQVGSLRMVEGNTGIIPLTVTNLATDFDGVPGEAEFATRVRITSNDNFPDGSAFNHTTDVLREGQTTTIEVPVEGTVNGDFNIIFTASDGELSAERDTTVQVISKERAREENRKWYEIPSPPALLLLLAAFALVAAARRR